MSNSTFGKFIIEDCIIPQYVSSLSELIQCYGFMMNLSQTRGIFELLFVIATITFNVFVYFMIYFRSVTWTVFDQAMLDQTQSKLFYSACDFYSGHSILSYICKFNINCCLFFLIFHLIFK